MADAKISALAALTGAGVDTAADVIAIVDTSTTTTKKILIDELRIALGLATQAQQETASSQVVNVTPGVQQFHPSAAKAWMVASGDGTTLQASYNTTSITDNGNGNITWTIATDFSSANWAVSAFTSNTGDGTSRIPLVNSGPSSGAVTFESRTTGGVPTDPSQWFAAGFGDQ